MSDLPIDFTELVDLASLGISPQSLDFRSTTFESDHYVTIRETKDNVNSVSIVDLKNNNNLIKKNMGGDSAIMHPDQFVISVRANGTIVQIFNLETKSKLKSFTLDEPCIYWNWLDDKHLGLVTARSIAYCNVFDGKVNEKPTILTQRHQNLNNTQIINFVANKKLDWFAVVGILQENGHIAGKVQLYSKQRNISQAIDGHVAMFSNIVLDGNNGEPVQIFITANRNVNNGNGELKVIEIDHDASLATQYQKKNVDIFFPPDAANDFPLGIQVSEKFGIIYLLTKYGFIHLYELETGTNLFVNRITAESVFTSTSYNDKNGIACINKKGQVLAVEISTSQIVPYVLNKLSNVNVALIMAKRGGLPGADDLLQKQFETLIAQGDFQNAAKVAASSSQLRNSNTINRLKNAQAVPGAISPLLLYFSTLLDNGKLNKDETIELARPVLQQNRKQLFEKWLKEDKLECSEQLGDIVKPFDTTLALACYLKANIHAKVVNCLAELQQFDKILPYCQKVDFKPNFLVLISSLIRSSPDRAAEFTTSLLQNEETASQIDIEKIADLFFSQNHIQQGTSLLLDVLKADTPEQSHLQTRVLEVNLLHAPQVADAILGNNIFSQYDKPRIAELSEKSNLFQRALENYTDIKDIKRCIVHTTAIPADWLVDYFGKLSVDQSFACLKALMDHNMQANIQIVVQVATKYSELLGSSSLIKMFEEYNAVEGLYFYLSSLVNLTEDQEIVYKYIESAAKMNQVNEIERIVRDNNVYDAERVKNFLKDANLENQIPLIVVCDRFDYVHELIVFLYQKHQMKPIETYVQQINPSKTPQVVGALLDVDSDEYFIKELLKSVLGQISITELTDEVEKRNRLKILMPFLEETLAQGNQDQAVYNSLAKIYIDSNNSPEKFLQENDQYDTVEVGRYCEKRDPYLAYIAYDKGNNDDELIKITNDNDMYKYQAKYLLKRSDPELWNKVLDPENPHRQPLVDSIVSVGIPSLSDPQPVSLTVQAFMNNGLKTELIELLEKIVLEPSPFSDNVALQGLLLLSAIKYEPSNVQRYIDRLDKYDPKEIGPLCIEHNLYEEAFEIYDKHEMNREALDVLVSNIKSLERAENYVEKTEKLELWSELGSAQLQSNEIAAGIHSYIKAEDPSDYMNVINIAETAGAFNELIPYLLMARKTLKETKIDSCLILAYAQLEKLSELEEILSGSNSANLEEVGDKLIELRNYKAAKLCYSSVSNYSKLASTLVYLNDFQEAVNIARKASNIRVWRLVNNSCIKEKEFKLAQICGLSLIIHAEEVDDIVDTYESNGYFEQLLSLFEAGLTLERAHMGMFTETAILYSKYASDKLYEYLKMYWSRVNIPKVIRVVEDGHQWEELIFLYAHYDEWDNAATTIIEKSTDKFDHEYFQEIVVKVSNLEIYYKAINFYIKEHPELLNELLKVLVPRLDIPRTIQLFLKNEKLYMIKDFLIEVLPKNISVVNSAYHDLMVEDNDYVSLEKSIEAYDKFDQLGLAVRLETHELIYFRKISALLYRRNKKWAKALNILKEEKLWKECIETAAISQDYKIIKELFEFFVSKDIKEGIIGLLFSGYNLFKYEDVLEQSWINGLNDIIKPYEISIKKEQNDSIEKLMTDYDKRKNISGEGQNNDGNTPLMLTSGMTYNQSPMF